MSQNLNHYRWFIILWMLILPIFKGTAADYLRFTAERKNVQVGYTNYGGNSPDVQYSLDEGNTWKTLAPDEYVDLEEEGDMVYFRGFNPEGFSHEPFDITYRDRSRKRTQFMTRGDFSVSGNVMSLIDGEGVTTTIPCEYCFSSLFLNCQISNGPSLPATNLTKGCYSYMFLYSSRLKNAPELPATELKEECYSHMFSSCSGITQAPELPATVMKNSCYESMFSNCGELIQAPTLPATQLADSCYSEMFQSTGLTKTPELPATQLAPYCYNFMFAQCMDLKKASELPATELAEACYRYMFSYCEGLRQAPELPAKQLKKNCYEEMFSDCYALEYIKVGLSTLDNDLDATKSWVSHVDGMGSFIFPCGSKYDKHGDSEVPFGFTIIGSPIVIFQNANKTEIYRDTIGCGETPKYEGTTPSAGEGTVFSGWDKPLEPLSIPQIYYYTAQYENMGEAPSDSCLCFTAEDDNVSLTIENIGDNNPNIEYTTNGGVTWSPLRAGEHIILAEKGDKVHVKGVNPNGFSRQEDVYTRFKMSGPIHVSGSVMSLIDGEGYSTEIPNAYCFAHLFENTTITQAPSLPAETLKESCYAYMFAGCETLHATPALPALEMAPYCYSHMFEECKGLDIVQSLPATKLAPYCYLSMFQNCKKLTRVFGELPARKMEEGCYERMFYGCEQIWETPELPALELSKRCYAFMFYGCASLYTTHTLYASKLAEECYASMYGNCTKLADNAKMFHEELAEGCCKEMYKGCTSLNRAILTGSELKKDCYREMFSGCTNLTYIKIDL